MEGGMPGSMFWLFGQLFLAPFQTFVFGMERLLETVQGIQDFSSRGMQAVAGGSVTPARPLQPATPASPQPANFNQEAANGGGEIAIEEIRRMDKNLNDDMLKLVRFKVLFVKRDYEHAFPEEEALVADNMDGSAFTAWKIAEFIQGLNNKPKEVSSKFKDYDKSHRDETRRDGIYLKSLREDDKKYLRVYYEVLERYPREMLHYQEDHLAELRKQTACLCEIAGRLESKTA